MNRFMNAVADHVITSFRNKDMWPLCAITLLGNISICCARIDTELSSTWGVDDTLKYISYPKPIITCLHPSYHHVPC